MLPTGGMPSAPAAHVAPAFDSHGRPVPRRPAQTTWRSGADEVAEGIVRRRIIDPVTMQQWVRSEVHRDILRYVGELCENVAGRKLTDEVPKSRVVHAICEVLQEAGTWIDELPPERHAMRYGNPAFKKWHARMCERTPALMRTLLAVHTADASPTATATLAAGAGGGAGGFPPFPTSFIGSAISTRVEYEASLQLPAEQRAALERAASAASVPAASAASSAVAAAAAGAATTAAAAAATGGAAAAAGDTRALELGAYFAESFGNATRVDYGTGHELAFLVR